MIKVGILVGGANYIKNIMDISSIFRRSSLIRIKVIDPLATDIDEIISVSNEVDYIFIDRNLPLLIRFKIAYACQDIACSLILFYPNKSTQNFKFYLLNNSFGIDTINMVLTENFNTYLRKSRDSKVNKYVYLWYILKENIKDYRLRKKKNNLVFIL